jgi:BirA family transcriptional regulator, biotin operon repressor / biotin---[acetyl-CoA-carboxylase] ligase
MKDFKHPFLDKIYYNKVLHSTNKKAQNLIRNGTSAGNFLVSCDQQTGGIGRKENYWYSPAGGLWFTAALYGLPLKPGFTIFTGICIHKAILEHIKTDLKIEFETADLKIKWPNDLYWKNWKICGILSHYLENWKYHLIGVGINTNIIAFPDYINNTATSLQNILKRELNNELLLKRIFDHFSQDLPGFLDNEFDLDYYLKNSFLSGKEIILATDFAEYSGLAQGINKQGALLLKLPSGMIQPFYAGTIVSWK